MLFANVQRSVRLNKKKKSTNTSPYPDEAIERLARAFYPAILACWNSEEGQRSLVGGKAPPSCLRKTVRSLKSPTGAFIAPLRCANASLPRGRRNRLTSPAKKNRAFPTGNALLYISLSCVDFCRVRPGGRALFFSWKTLRLLPILESGCHSNRQSCGNLLKCSAVGYV